MAEGRASRHARGQRKSYNIDPLAGLEIEGVSNVDINREEANLNAGERDGGPSSDEFEIGQEEEEEEDADEFMEDATIGEFEGEEGEEDGEYGADDGEGDDAKPKHNTKATKAAKAKVSKVPKTTKTPKEKAKKNKSSERPSKKNAFGKGSLIQWRSQNQKIASAVKIRQRGVDEWMPSGQAIRFKMYFGPTIGDIYPALQTRDYFRLQEAFPSRQEGNLRRSFYLAEEARAKEVKNTREWYRKSGKLAFCSAQKTRELENDEWKSYMCNAGPDSMDLLMGNATAPKLYTLEKGSFMKAATPFEPNTKRRGWVFNLGAKIQEAQWAPNEEGRTQYLAVAVEQKSTKGPNPKLFENPTAPAFVATGSFSASIQIWAFDSFDNGDMNPHEPPRLEAVICTDWGAPKRFAWWPIGSGDQVVCKDDEDEEAVHLGLLAGIWSDGKLRILDVFFKNSDLNTQRTVYIHYTRAAFEVAFPETVPTGLCWLSGTSIAVATAAGTIAIWSLNRPGVFTPLNPSSPTNKSTQFMPKPWLYTQVSDTYILSLSSGYPSRPNYLSITTGDGFSRLMDLRSPVVESCTSARTRMLISSQAWHDYTQTFIMADEYYMLKHASLRRYYANSYTMKLESSLICCATSPVQPCILVGGADGTVAASNPTGKVMNTKNPVWQHTWFKHEWRRPVEQILRGIHHPSLDKDSPTPGAAGAGLPIPTNENVVVPPSCLEKPLTRITEGYSPYKISTSGRDEMDRTREGGNLIAIFEEPSAVTKLAWNSNLKFGTWAIAGTSNGYLRVEDLGV